jgi:hypothetical protein
MAPGANGIGERSTHNDWRTSIHVFREAAASLCAESEAHADESLKRESRRKCEETRDLYLQLLELANAAVPEELVNPYAWREAMKSFDTVAANLDDYAQRVIAGSGERRLAEEEHRLAATATALADEIRDVGEGLKELLVRSPNPPLPSRRPSWWRRNN